MSSNAFTRPPSVPCPELGAGWTLQIVPRRTGNHVDRYWFSPEGRKFRSRAEVDRFLNSEKPVKHPVAQGRYSIGQTISKCFRSEESDSERYFSGKITDFDEKSGLYKVVFDDDDEEEFTADEVVKLMTVEKQHASSPLARKKKRKLNRVSTDNPYKKSYKPKDARPNAKSTRKEKGISADNGGSNDHAKSTAFKQVDVSGKSKTKIAKRKSGKTAVNSTGKKSSHTIQSKTSPIKSPVDSLPSILTSSTSPMLTLATDNSQTLISLAKHRVDSAKRWIASATLSYDTARRNLDAAKKCRLDAFKEHTEAEVIYDRVLKLLASSGSKKTSQGTLNNSARTAVVAGTVQKSSIGAMKNNEEVPSGSKKTSGGQLDNPKVALSTPVRTAVINVAIEKSSIGAIKNNEDADKPNDCDKPTAATSNNEDANKSSDGDKSITATSEGKQEGNEKTDTLIQPSSEFNIESTEATRNLSNPPPRKISSLFDGIAANDACPEAKTNTEDTASSESRNGRSGDDEDKSVLHLKPSPASLEQKRPVGDLLPGTQEFLREAALSSISNNGEVDDVHLPEQPVFEFSYNARERVHDVGSDPANKT